MTERAALGPKARSPKTGPSKASPLAELYARPGFLIRRAHQVSVGLFLEEVGGLAITTTQYGALAVLKTYRDLDQIGLSKRLGIDRSTAALVVGKLEAGGLIAREVDAQDRRRNVLRLTSRGAEVLAQLAEPAERARSRLLAALSEREAQRFITLLAQFVSTFNDEARAPIAPVTARLPFGSADAR